MELNSGWIVGFVDGEGCFHVSVNKHSEMTVGFQVLPEFTVVQHIRDINVLHALKEYFGCGVVRVNNEDRWAYRVRSISNLEERIIPFFEKHKLKTKKRVDFEKFKDVVNLIKQGKHLTKDGISEIQTISSNMNRKGNAK